MLNIYFFIYIMDSKYLQFITEYNYHLKYIGRLYVSKCKGTPNEEMANRNLKRIMLAINETPEFMLTESGPYLLKYADQIKNDNWEIFMNMDYKEIDNSQTSKVQIDILKNTYKMCTEKEKKIITNSVKELLSVYCKYVLLLKSSA